MSIYKTNVGFLEAESKSEADYKAKVISSLKTVCAWSNKVIKEGELIEGKVSHGCCEECKSKVIEGG